MELIRKKGIDIPVVQRYGEMEYLQYPALAETGVVEHLFTTRLGGVSEGYLGTMNVSYSRGDVKENVDENFRRVATILNGSFSDFVFTQQTHTDNIRIVTEEDRGKGTAKALEYSDIDGILTNQKGLILSAFFADCVPLFFVDRSKKVIGLAHSGWKGTVLSIGAKMIDRMVSEFCCDKEDIITAIGPSICQDCYEISEDVAEQFIKAYPDWEKDILIHKGNGKYQLDLWKCNALILEKAGIAKERIHCTNLCTCCNPEYLFSHRASKGMRGNLGAFLKLK